MEPYTTAVCFKCHCAGHLARDCPENVCSQCNGNHQQKDCHQLREMRRIVLWFPFQADARIIGSANSVRHMDGIRPFMRSLREEPDTTVDGNRIYGRHNAMKIDYNGRSSIVIALQDAANRKSETLIHVRPERVAIGNRYRIVGENLNERFERSGVGSVDMKAPSATVHILIVVENLFEWPVSLQITYTACVRRFYLQWAQWSANNRVEPSIHVSSAYGFDFNEAMKTRPAIGDKAVYYKGYDPAAAGAIIEDESEQPPEPNAIAADIIDAVMHAVNAHSNQSDQNRDTAADNTAEGNADGPSTNDDADIVIEEEILITTSTDGATITAPDQHIPQ